ncbi:TadE/TadG family type IV pilus assembly protein [Schumannella sp. 10F1B-5-1]|uniref:TadE/TadG family type IV pilus assembly protein n=1 Tax=Schumannella sp. 10F1B-5-1 TaxID=2590780 RepID=UPI001130E01A|nr:TadE/TadG family type IV pilus assembly protein [Schumannella sp. 10F1B-5-1]TPW73350.1 pilus assembly protein [Schumannella sp. 10F1B-5-1]
MRDPFAERRRRRPRAPAVRLIDDRGSAPAEFVLVGALLALVTLAVLQLALALFVRNTVLDAAAEGARQASLADVGPDAGVERTRDLIAATLGDGYAVEVAADTGEWQGQPVAIVTVRAPLPVIGLIGIPSSLEVSGHAAIEDV